MFPWNKDKKVTIRFRFDGQRVTWKDQKVIYKIGAGTLQDPEELQILAAHFMVDEKGEYLSDDKAIGILDRLTQEEQKDVIDQFLEAVTESTIPKANGSSSSLPSEAGPVEPSLSGPVS